MSSRTVSAMSRISNSIASVQPRAIDFITLLLGVTVLIACAGHQDAGRRSTAGARTAIELAANKPARNITAGLRREPATVVDHPVNITACASEADASGGPTVQSGTAART